MSLILKAAAFAADAHRTQKRKWTGRPYIEHPGRVAARVSVLPNVTEIEVAAAWLHDVFEDQPEHTAIVEANMPADVIYLVKELTKENLAGMERKKRKAADRARLTLASRWAKIIKLIDRLDNLRDISEAESGFRRLYLQESLLLANALLDYTDPVNKELYLELMTEIAINMIGDRLPFRYVE